MDEWLFSLSGFCLFCEASLMASAMPLSEDVFSVRHLMSLDEMLLMSFLQEMTRSEES